MYTAQTFTAPWLRWSTDERWCAALLLLLLVLLTLVYAVWLANADLLAAVHTRPELFGLRVGAGHGGDEYAGGDGSVAAAAPLSSTPKKQR